MTITAAEAAAMLDGGEYTKEGSVAIFAEMKGSGLVAVFGASDDNMEFRGAISDEVGCYGGGTAYLDRDGLLQNDCEDEGCPYFAKIKESAATITALWDVDGIAWRYETKIQHVKFTINEDGTAWCEGIVFALSDCRPGGEIMTDKEAG